MHYACFYGYEDIVDLLIGAKMNIEHKDVNGKTALDIAKSQGFIEIVEMLKINVA